jgi:AcrR family transcriptional regulator
VDEQKALRVMRELVENGQLTDPDSARGKLLQVAAHLFRNKGYERTTVRDLAGAVGIQSGSIFHHFKSKEEILRAVMEETIRYNTALMRAAIADASNVRERVLALIRCELQSIMGGSGEAMAVLVYEWRSCPRTVRPRSWRCAIFTKRSGCRYWGSEECRSHSR